MVKLIVCHYLYEVTNRLASFEEMGFVPSRKPIYSRINLPNSSSLPMLNVGPEVWVRPQETEQIFEFLRVVVFGGDFAVLQHSIGIPDHTAGMLPPGRKRIKLNQIKFRPRPLCSIIWVEQRYFSKTNLPTGEARLDTGKEPIRWLIFRDYQLLVARARRGDWQRQFEDAVIFANLLVKYSKYLMVKLEETILHSPVDVGRFVQLLYTKYFWLSPNFLLKKEGDTLELDQRLYAAILHRTSLSDKSYWDISAAKNLFLRLNAEQFMRVYSELSKAPGNFFGEFLSLLNPYAVSNDIALVHNSLTSRQKEILGVFYREVLRRIDSGQLVRRADLGNTTLTRNQIAKALGLSGRQQERLEKDIGLLVREGFISELTPDMVVKKRGNVKMYYRLNPKLPYHQFLLDRLGSPEA